MVIFSADGETEVYAPSIDAISLSSHQDVYYAHIRYNAHSVSGHKISKDEFDRIFKMKELRGD